VREFTGRGYTVVGFERSKVDISDAASVERTLAGEDPGIVVNAAAYNQVDVAENEPVPAFMANGLAVRNLAMACRQLDANFVHFSTDYVFDGTAGRAYTENDRPHPLGAYGVSKLAGELYAQAYLDKPLVIRTSGVFGPGGLKTARGNFIETMLRLAAGNLGVRRWLWWRRVMLPAIFPAYVTGAVTAAGGSWNASIVSEVVQWGDTTLTATGLGAYIAQYTASGDAARITLGIGVLCLYVLAFNRLLWRRLYNLAAERLRMD